MSGPAHIRWCDHCQHTRYAACSPVCRIPNDHKDNWIRNTAVEDEGDSDE